MHSHFTKEERTVLVCLGIILCVGSALHYALKRYPVLHDIVNVLDGEDVYLKTDVNSAGAAELERVPYIGPATARRIVDYREKHGPFAEVGEIRGIPGVRRELWGRFKGYLEVKGQGHGSWVKGQGNEKGGRR